ncbi:FHA domain-containing protein [Leifsonia aquatica]|uniref:FHA domain-containing protein n=1 Tax=Leifsonia aquatica TaxID=144185 RepID=UPI0028A9B960|nr:FHA domain-containing protein [Leifsonia aquatica]
MSSDPTSAVARAADAANGFVRYAPTAGPSRWLLIAGRRFVAAVESTVSDEIIDAVWWLAGSELATIESVVGAFPLAGPDSVRSFAVAEIGRPGPTGDVVVTAVVRGSAAIDIFSVGGSRRFAAAGVQPWVLAEFRSVTGLVLGADDAPTGPVARLSIGSLPVGLGVVDGELLTWSLAPIERVERSAAPEAAPTVRPQAGTEPDAAAGETIIPQRGGSLFGHAGAPSTSAALTPVPLAGGEVAPLTERPVAHELPGAVDIETPASGPDTPDALTFSPVESAQPPTKPVVLPPVPATFAVRLGAGDILPLDAPVVFGRHPSASRVESGVAPRLVSVVSATQEVSGTHVRIEQSGDAVVVTDLRSTNGTRVIAPGGAGFRLRPGESTVALAGATVEIGDGNIIEITAAPGGTGGTDGHRDEEGRE